jgi:hypothetical protein
MPGERVVGVDRHQLAPDLASSIHLAQVTERRREQGPRKIRVIRNRVRRTGALFASSLLWQSARRLWSGPSLSAMKSSLCLDMVGDCRWRDAASFPAEPTQRLDTQLMRFNPRSRRADRRIRRRSAVWLCGVSRSASCATAHCRRFRLRELRRIDTYYRVSTPMTKHSFCVLDDTRQMKAKAPGQH